MGGVPRRKRASVMEESPGALERTPSASVDAKERIVAAARGQVLRGGEGAASSAQVANAAGVSKALVYYHFHDNRELLCGLVEDCEERIRNRLERDGRLERRSNPVEEFRAWVEREFDAGDANVLIRLGQVEDVVVRQASLRAVETFQAAVGRQMETTFQRLRTPPPLPMDFLAKLMATMIIGVLAGGDGVSAPERNELLDMVWLAVLRLGD